jgi:predicted PurR-regulated permease PerM
MDNKRTLQTIFIYALFALFFVLLIRMFYPFFTVILWTALLYIIIYPLYRKCHNKLNPEKKLYEFKRRVLAGGFSLGLMVIIIAVFGLIIFMLSKQLVSFLSETEKFLESNPNFFKESELFRKLSEIAEKFGFGFVDFDITSISSKLLSLLREYSSKLISVGTNLVSGIGNFVISVFFVIFGLYFCFLDGKYLASLFGKAIPINPKQMTSLMSKFAEISKNLLSGYVLVALYQGFASFVLMTIFGVKGALLFSVVLMFCTFVPIFGAALIWFPVGLVICISGSVVKGIIFMILAAICISLLDNFIRPLFLKNRIQVHPLIIFFAILGGLSLFGLNGLLLGPMIVILFFTILDMLVSKEEETENPITSYQE